MATTPYIYTNQWGHDTGLDTGHDKPKFEIICGFCYEDVPVDSSGGVCPNHRLCRRCIQRMVGDAAKCEISYPPHCCNATIITLADVEHIIEPTVVSLYKEKMVEYNTAPLKRVFCGNPQCAAFLEHASRNSGHSDTEIHCPSCGLFTCAVCKEALPHICKSESAIAPSLDYSANNRCKRCPFCTTPLWLAEACNHMTCGVCKGEFCFICLQPWKDVSGHPEIHRCPQYGDPTYDEEGYDLRGFHRDTGYDRDGYNLRGLNAAGRNRQGGIEPIYYRGRRKQRAQPLKELRLDGDPLMDDLNITFNEYWADDLCASDCDDTAGFYSADEDSWSDLEILEGTESQDCEYWGP